MKNAATFFLFAAIGAATVLVPAVNKADGADLATSTGLIAAGVGLLLGAASVYVKLNVLKIR